MFSPSVQTAITTGCNLFPKTWIGCRTAHIFKLCTWQKIYQVDQIEYDYACWEGKIVAPRAWQVIGLFMVRFTRLQSFLCQQGKRNHAICIHAICKIYSFEDLAFNNRILLLQGCCWLSSCCGDWLCTPSTTQLYHECFPVKWICPNMPWSSLDFNKKIVRSCVRNKSVRNKTCK